MLMVGRLKLQRSLQPWFGGSSGRRWRPLRHRRAGNGPECGGRRVPKRKLTARAAAATAMLLLVVGSACLGGCSSHNCTTIGGVDGVGVELAGALPGQLEGGTVRICIEDSCSDQDVHPSITSVTESCPITTCFQSTTATAPTADVFVSMATTVSRRRTVTVTVTATDAGHVVVAHGSADTRLTDTYLNGPDCGVTSRVGALTLTSAGLVARS